MALTEEKQNCLDLTDEILAQEGVDTIGQYMKLAEKLNTFLDASNDWEMNIRVEAQAVKIATALEECFGEKFNRSKFLAVALA